VSVARAAHGVNEQKFLRTPEGSAEFTYACDLRGNILEMNEALERVTGYSRQEALLMNMGDFMEPESWERSRQNILEHVGGAAPEPHRVVLRTRRGRPLTLELTTRLVFEKGHPVAVQSFGRDVSEDDLLALRETEARLWTTASELARFSAHLKQLHRLSTAAYQSLDEVLTAFLAAGCKLFELPNGTILQVEGDAGLVRAFHGESNLLSAGTRIPLAATPCVSLADRLRTQAYNSPTPNNVLHPDLQICVATPILVDAELYGALTFSSGYSPEPRIFSREEREIIELMARGVGRFILEDRIQAERKRSEEVERNRNRVLEMVAEDQPLTPTLTQLARMLERQSNGPLCSALVLQDGLMRCLAAPSLPQSYCDVVNGLELRTSAASALGAEFTVAPVFSPDIAEHPLWAGRFPREDLSACLSTPILASGGQLLGIMMLHYGAGARHSVADGEALEAAARLAAIAVEHRQLTDQLAFQARHDSLTGLPNRSCFLELLERALREAVRRDGVASVLFIDLDRFKQINDTLGHAMGDQLLKQVAARLTAALPGEDDVAARMGGDEFTIILAKPPNEEFALAVSRRLLNALRLPYFIDGHELFVTPSIGISFFPNDGEDAPTLLRNADLAMYHAKNAGKNDLERFVPGPQRSSLERLELENALRRALEKSEFELYFQPIVATDGRLDGLEALLAWNHPRLGRIPPKVFIPIAEETGQIVEIGWWVLSEACLQAARWLALGLDFTSISVNVSAVQFARADFVDSVANALALSGLAPKRLELELTESFVMKDIAESARRMSQLRALGVSMSIDDFGTGYSSLSYLRSLPADSLKIDQSFLRDLHAPAGSMAVIQTIVMLAHNMNLSVVAEGVETLEDLEALKAAGCDRVQGHLYGASLRAHEAERLLALPDRIVPVQRSTTM
jgi:diguanylate cyclase (GGDEF)-like protein/PAS domain S-box-containing protein